MTLAIWFISFLMSVVPPVAPAATSGVSPSYLGYWLGQDQDAVVEISRQGDYLVGRYVAFRKDPVKRKAQLNTYALKDLKPDGKDLAGKVRDGNTGKEYKGTLRFTGPNTVEVSVKVMGMTVYKEVWTRQPSAK